MTVLLTCLSGEGALSFPCGSEESIVATAAGARTQGVGRGALFIHKDVRGEEAGAFPASCF